MIFAPGEQLRMPPYQRSYSWEAKEANELLTDLIDSAVITSYSIHYTKLYDPPGNLLPVRFPDLRRDSADPRTIPERNRIQRHKERNQSYGSEEIDMRKYVLLSLAVLAAAPARQ